MIKRHNVCAKLLKQCSYSTGTNGDRLLKNSRLRQMIYRNADFITIIGIIGIWGALTGYTVGRRLDQFDAHFSARFDKFDANFDRFSAKFDARLDAMESKFDFRFDAMESKFDGKFVGIENKFDGIGNTIDGIRKLMRDNHQEIMELLTTAAMNMESLDEKTIEKVDR